jgi:hypothetical protein
MTAPMWLAAETRFRFLDHLIRILSIYILYTKWTFVIEENQRKDSLYTRTCEVVRYFCLKKNALVVTKKE